jgi:enamine deaminase RidA (YjgF/YER057c/UK114 family)
MRPVRLARASVVLFAVLAAAPSAPGEDKPREGARQQSRIVVPESTRAIYESWGFAPAVVARDGTIYVSGAVVRLDGEGSYEERYAAGFKKAIRRIEEVLAAAGASLDDVLDITSYHTDLARQLQAAVKARKEVMPPPHPAWTAVGTTALAVPDGVTEIRVIAKLPAAK